MVLKYNKNNRISKIIILNMKSQNGERFLMGKVKLMMMILKKLMK